MPEAIVEMVAAGLGISVLARWAVQNAVDDGRIVALRAGEDGIVIPWYAATRAGSGAEDKRHHRVARLLAEWSRVNGGLSGGE